MLLVFSLQIMLEDCVRVRQREHTDWTEPDRVVCIAQGCLTHWAALVATVGPESRAAKACKAAAGNDIASAMPQRVRPSFCQQLCSHWQSGIAFSGSHCCLLHDDSSKPGLLQSWLTLPTPTACTSQLLDINRTKLDNSEIKANTSIPPTLPCIQFSIWNKWTDKTYQGCHRHNILRLI